MSYPETEKSGAKAEAPPSEGFKWTTRAKKETYREMETTVSIGSGGELKASYILVGGTASQPPENCVCKMGLNEEGLPETNFEPDDEARFILTLHNCSGANLTHVYAERIKIVCGDESSLGSRPDGLPYLQLTPDDRYFGTIGKGESVCRELALISRGAKPGVYRVEFHFTYDIQGCPVTVPLDICVKDD